MQTSEFYSHYELKEMLGDCGENPKVHRSVKFFGSKQIFLGNNVRLDAYCVLSGPLDIGDTVHFGPMVSVLGGQDVIIGNFVGIAAKSSIFSVSDDYTGGHMAGPLVPMKYRKPTGGTICLHDHVLIGSMVTILPNVVMNFGSAAMAHSVIVKDVASGHVVQGMPARPVLKRDIKKLKELEERLYLESQG